MDDYKRETRNAYDANAATYAKKFEALLDFERRAEFKQFIELIPGNNILDLGCGGGNHSLYFQNKGLNVTAIDYSSSMVDLCKEKGIDAKVMDIESLEFPSESFDGVWAVTSLLHIPKNSMPKVVDSIHKILKEKGIFYVCVKEGTGEYMVPDKTDSSISRFFAFYKSAELIDLLEPTFNLMEFKKTKFIDQVYLEGFFRKI